MNTPVQTKQELIRAILSHRETILAYGVVQLGIFGSFVTGQTHPQSDVDLYISFDPKYKTLKNLVGLATYLTALLGRRVELVTPESLSKLIGPHILKQVEYVPIAA